LAAWRTGTINDCNSGILEFPGFSRSRNSGNFHEKILEISENVNAVNSMMKFSGGRRLLSSQSLTVSQTLTHSQHNLHKLHDTFSDCSVLYSAPVTF